MMTFKIDVSGAINGIQGKLDALRDASLDRQAALYLAGVMPGRIHEEGIASDGSPIGTYSPAYMKVRTDNYGNSGKFKRGANAGKIKDAGVFSRGKKKGQPRPQYKRSADPKIVVSLTKGIENDWTALPTDRGWGVGFKKPYNYQKLRWVEAQKKRKIGSPTKEEYEATMKELRTLVQEILNS